MKFWRFERLITKEGYYINQTLKPTNLNHPTRNPPPKRFLYKPRHFHATFFYLLLQSVVTVVLPLLSLHREFHKIG